MLSLNRKELGEKSSVNPDHRVAEENKDKDKTIRTLELRVATLEQELLKLKQTKSKKYK